MDLMDEATREEVFAHFDGLPVVYLATVEGDQPRVRPVTIVHHEKQLFTLTGTGSAKADQLGGNDHFEFCLPLVKGEQNGSIRVEGHAVVIEDTEMRAAVANAAPYFGMYWKGVDDPTYTLLHLKIETVELMRPTEICGIRYRI